MVVCAIFIDRATPTWLWSNCMSNLMRQLEREASLTLNLWTFPSNFVPSRFSKFDNRVMKLPSGRRCAHACDFLFNHSSAGPQWANLFMNFDQTQRYQKSSWGCRRSFTIILSKTAMTSILQLLIRLIFLKRIYRWPCSISNTLVSTCRLDKKKKRKIRRIRRGYSLSANFTNRKIWSKDLMRKNGSLAWVLIDSVSPISGTIFDGITIQFQPAICLRAVKSNAC